MLSLLLTGGREVATARQHGRVSACGVRRGVGWGDGGYFKMQRGVNMCGVAQCSSFPLVPFSATASGP